MLRKGREKKERVVFRLNKERADPYAAPQDNYWWLDWSSTANEDRTKGDPMNPARRFTRLPLSLGLFSLVAAGCGGTDDLIDQPELQSKEQAAYSCRSGYHYHYIDWSATRITPPLTACGGGKLVYNGDPFCQQDGAASWVCDTSMVYGYDPRDGYAGWVKILALSAHD
jgi:hypothetical protein